LEIQNERKVYPNYLNEINNNKPQTIKKSPNHLYDGELSRIQTIIDNKNIKRLDKVEEVKTSLQKLSLVYQSNKEK
jgi:CHAT domain-containing protein